MERLMEWELSNCQMVQCMMVNGQMEDLIKVNALIQMEKFMKESGKMGSLLDQELKLGMMVGNMMDYGEMESLMGKVKKYIQMVKLKKDIGIKASLLKEVRINS